MAGQFSDWSPYQNYVQAGMVDGSYATGAFTLIAAGPPRIAQIGTSVLTAGKVLGGALDAQVNQIVYPIGIVQNFSVSHNRQYSRIFEIGSERSYFIAGRTVGQIGLGRVFYHGASLLRVLYAYYQDVKGAVSVKPMFQNLGALTTANPHDVVIPPGYENIFVNLASDLFAQPIGILMYVKDMNLNVLGAIYFEASYIPNHTWATDSQGVLIQEQVAVQFERAVPVNVSGLTLITGDNAGGSPGSTSGLGIGGLSARGT
jgi:hypothetical protein